MPGPANRGFHLLSKLPFLMHNAIPQIAVASAGLALLVGGILASTQEISPYLTDYLPQPDRISAYIDGTSVPGLAISTQTAYLLGCYDLMRSSALYAQSPQQDKDLTKICHDAAEHLANQTQTNALAWFVLAFAAAKTGNLDAMSDALRNSYLTGPNEQWIALLRIPLAEINRPRLDADMQHFGDLDLGMAAKSNTGTAGIVDLYSNDPTFREHLTRIVEQSSPAEQQQFLWFLRNALRHMTAPKP